MEEICNTEFRKPVAVARSLLLAMTKLTELTYSSAQESQQNCVAMSVQTSRHKTNKRTLPRSPPCPRVSDRTFISEMCIKINWLNEFMAYIIPTQRKSPPSVPFSSWWTSNMTDGARLCAAPAQAAYLDVLLLYQPETTPPTFSLPFGTSFMARYAMAMRSALNRTVPLSEPCRYDSADNVLTPSRPNPMQEIGSCALRL